MVLYICKKWHSSPPDPVGQTGYSAFILINIIKTTLMLLSEMKTQEKNIEKTLELDERVLKKMRRPKGRQLLLNDKHLALTLLYIIKTNLE